MTESGAVILWPEDPLPSPEAISVYGGKAAALRRMGEADLPVPPWFVVAPEAYRRSRTAAAAAPKRTSAADAIVPSSEICDEITAALQRLLPDGAGRVAVRSSAVDEDGAGHSFAGQFESYLWVTPEDVPARVADVWRSAFSERVLSYRAERGLPPEPVAPAVLVQRMVDADAAGVAFSADPVSGRRGVAVVAAVLGLGTALVGGEADADTWDIDRDGVVLHRTVADKTTAHRPGAGGGVREEPVAHERRGLPAITDARAVAVAALARQAERLTRRPQDIEWAVDAAGVLYLLQSRPITTLAGRPDPDGVINVWDNSNIAESYNGITTPLTFSFARNAYEHVYREFCRLLSVPESRIAERDLAFRNLLGLIRGRVYYNLPNWYRLLALLPGYRLNRTFMEQMMGVRESLPEEVIHPPAFRYVRSTSAGDQTARSADRIRDAFALARSIFGLIRQHHRLPATIRDFYDRLDTALAPTNDDLALMRADELAAHYHDLERRLLTRWDAPLVNDFFAMIFHGLLRRLTERWIPGDETLHNDLISGEGGIVSAEPAQRVQAMAASLAGDAAAIAALCDQPVADALRWTRRERPELAAEFDRYLAKFGDRCLEELKLESMTLDDDPTPLLRAVGALARRGRPVTREAEPETESPRVRAEARVASALRANPLRASLYRGVLRRARERVRDRENLRFERTRVFGRVRRIFLEIGRRFCADGLLDDPRDVFYLDIGELLGAVEGTATCGDLRGLAAVRRAEFARYRSLPAPADRFETRGAVAAPGHDVQGRPEADAPAEDDADLRQGLACCPGIVRGAVRVVIDPRGATLPPGSILVAERTDPGWILLFPAAAGLLVERGSLLSHSAIVAREMRIPCIVSVPGVTGWLRDGDCVEMDGATGRVRRITAGTSEEEVR